LRIGGTLRAFGKCSVRAHRVFMLHIFHRLFGKSHANPSSDTVFNEVWPFGMPSSVHAGPFALSEGSDRPGREFHVHVFFFRWILRQQLRHFSCASPSSSDTA
ncbi:unnamed protein product, partial [Ectocarpus sp. 13 AM-2016]